MFSIKQSLSVITKVPATFTGQKQLQVKNNTLLKQNKVPQTAMMANIVRFMKFLINQRFDWQCYYYNMVVI